MKILVSGKADLRSGVRGGRHDGPEVLLGWGSDGLLKATSIQKRGA